MDLTMVDVSHIDCQEGDEVEVFGKNIRVQELADKLHTIPYEVLTAISPRVKRIYLQE
jgi:alanine racemase